MEKCEKKEVAPRIDNLLGEYLDSDGRDFSQMTLLELGELLDDQGYAVQLLLCKGNYTDSVPLNREVPGE